MKFSLFQPRVRFLLLIGTIFSLNSPASSALSVPDKIADRAVSGEIKPATSIVGKNMARYHMGTILEKYDRETRYYLPDQSAVAWLDEDDTTIAVIPAGKQWYLMSLDSPTLIQNFSIAAVGLRGKISLYASDQMAPPDSKKWIPLLKKVLAQDLNEKEYQKPLYSFTRYVLLETELTQSAEVSSLYLFTDSDASSYRLVKRPESTRFTDKAGPFFKDSKGQVNFAGKYARNSGSDEDENLKKMVDESPESSGTIDQKPMVIDFQEVREIERISIFAEKKKGTMRIALEGDRGGGGPLPRAYIPDAVQLLLTLGWKKPRGILVQGTGGEVKSSNEMSQSIVFDGITDRFSVQLPPTASRFLTLSWASGDQPATPIKIKNFSAMGFVSLNDFQVSRRFEVLTGNANHVLPEGGGGDSSSSEVSQSTSAATSLRNRTINRQEIINLPPVVPVSN